MKQQTQARCQTNEKSHNYIACDKCAMEPVCLPIKTDQQAITLADQYLLKRTPSNQEEYLIRDGEPLTNIYAVCAGTFKLTKISPFNEEKVIGFRFPGELIGDDAIHPKVYTHNASAIGDGSVCKVNVEQLISCSKAIPALQTNLVELLTRQSYISQKQFEALISKKSAESLVAAFLLNVAKRRADIEPNPQIVNLTMSRDNIANFLGLRRETLSRIFSKLQKDELIKQANKQIYLLNKNALFDLANI